VLEVLMRQPWPGNVRQLENTIFRAVVLADGPYLTAHDFPFLAAEFEAAGVEAGPPRIEDEDEHIATPSAPLAAMHAATLVGNSASESESVHVFDRDGHLRTLEQIEKDLIALAIETYEGRMSEVARRLGMGRSTLYRKLRDHGLEIKRAS
jgi:DNA-binding NtrC family response regulator